MAIDPLRLFHPSRPDRIAVIAVAPAAGAADRWVVNVARGAKRTALTDARMFGPFSAEEVLVAHRSVLQGLLDEGYVQAGLGGLLLALQANNPKVRARAAQRLGWRRERAAVDLLLKLTEKPKEDISSVVDALGLIGDARAIPAVAAEADKKLLSRRRSGVEALRNLAAFPEAFPDAKAPLQAARARSLERLPDGVRAVVDHPSEKALTEALLALEVKERGLAIDTVYELGAPVQVRAVVAALLSSDFHKPNLWRYAKSVWKRAMLRGDHETFGVLARAVEVRARTATATTASLKSGYDGEVKETRVYGKDTVDYVRRRGWRYLRRLAQHRPDEYALAAAAAIAPYVDGDDVVQGKSPATGRSYLLHRVLFGGSSRYELDARRLRFRLKPGAPKTVPGVREEAWPELWDRNPRAWVRLLGTARHTLVQRFALDGALRNPEALRSASHTEVAALLESDDARIVDLGLAELKRRFDPAAPDLEIIYVLASSSKDLVRHHGLTWLSEAAPVWIKDHGQVVRFLAMAQPASREAAARLVNALVRGQPAEHRRVLAQELLARVEQLEHEEGALSGYARVLREGLLEEATAACPIARAVALVGGVSDAAISVGAAILAKKPGALDLLGVTRVLAMASHEKAAVRSAALALLEGATGTLARDPSALFGLIESEWDDVRTRALRLLDRVDLVSLGLDGLMGLADSTYVEVQKKAHQIFDRAVADPSSAIDVHELLARLAQHPSPVTRRYAIELAVTHLKPGFVRLAKLELLFRAALFDTWPDRKVKRTAIAFLAERGQQDENQAEVAAQILGDFVRTQTLDDRERALQALVLIQLKYPGLQTPVTVVETARSAGGQPS